MRSVSQPEVKDKNLTPFFRLPLERGQKYEEEK
jgi:hypothetical protein